MLTPKDLKAIEQIFDIKLKPLKSTIKKIDDKLDAMIRLYDQEYVHLRKRVDRVEDHLNLSPLKRSL